MSEPAWDRALLSISRDDLTVAIARVAADAFDPETLNPDHLVIDEEEGGELTAVTLLGWEGDRWRCRTADGREILTRRVADPYLCRRLATFIVHHGRLTVFRWEREAVGAQVLAPLATRAVQLALDPKRWAKDGQ